MKYQVIISFALLGLSTVACLPMDNDASKLRTSNHISTSIDHAVHDKTRHRTHSRHTKHKHPLASVPPSNANTTESTSAQSGTVPAELVPQFGIQSGVDPQHGNCKGLKDILIPCACPPDRNAFIAKMTQFVAAGNAEGTPITFPTDDSLKSQITRLSASIVTLQNFNGRPGHGCPASSTTFVGQRAALLAKL